MTHVTHSEERSMPAGSHLDDLGQMAGGVLSGGELADGELAVDELLGEELVGLGE